LHRQSIAETIHNQHAHVVVDKRNTSLSHVHAEVSHDVTRKGASKAKEPQGKTRPGSASIKDATKPLTKQKLNAVAKEPCLEWFDGDVRVTINLLDSHDDRLSAAPHFLMTPTAFSTPSYFERACIIGSPEPTTEKCSVELQVIASLKDRIEIAIKTAQKEGQSVNETLRAAFPHSLCVNNEPWKSFILCHCTKCSPDLTEIPDELRWRDTWNMVGMCHNFEPGRNLCPSSAQSKREEVREKIALDDLFRTAWNIEMGKVLEEHRASVVQRGDLNVASPQNETTKEQLEGARSVQEHEGIISKAGSNVIGTHKLAVIMQALVTMGAVFFSFFMYMR